MPKSMLGGNKNNPDLGTGSSRKVKRKKKNSGREAALLARDKFWTTLR
jgi:hypothetical protein